MAKRCKHIWQPTKFLGDPLRDAWGCKWLEHCSECGKDRERYADDEEVKEEAERRTCKRCRRPLAEHAPSASQGVVADTCLTLLFDRFEELERRLRSLERWREA